MRGYPIFVFKFAAEIAKHVWRDGEMFRRHGVVTVEIVEFFGIFEITFDYVPRVAVGGNIHEIKVGNFVLRKEAEIFFWQRLRRGRSIEVICV